jgi:P27 family predicted phage terminase small subunit
MPPRKLSPFTSAGPRAIAGQPLVEVPDPPAWMRPIAKAKFVEVAEYLVALGSVTSAELPLVEMFAVAYCHFVEAETLLAGDPLTYRAVLNRQGEEACAPALPAAAQSAKAVDQMRRIGAALGLTPVDRSKLPSTRDSGEPDPMDTLLAKRAG